MTPKLRQNKELTLTQQKNVGIHILPIRFLRPTTALSADEQRDTHERIADTPESVH